MQWYGPSNRIGNFPYSVSSIVFRTTLNLVICVLLRSSSKKWILGFPLSFDEERFEEVLTKHWQYLFVLTTRVLRVCFCDVTWFPSYVQLPNFISQCWSSKGNHVMSILHVLLKMPGGTYKQLPLCLTTIFVWYVPSNPSSALSLCIIMQIRIISGVGLNKGRKLYGKKERKRDCKNANRVNNVLIKFQWWIQFINRSHFGPCMSSLKLNRFIMEINCQLKLPG